jgi:hypothetical protein
MKKKLSLHRETLAHLNPEAISAAGAGPNATAACSFTVCTGCGVVSNGPMVRSVCACFSFDPNGSCAC